MGMDGWWDGVRYDMCDGCWDGEEMSLMPGRFDENSSGSRLLRRGRGIVGEEFDIEWDGVSKKRDKRCIQGNHCSVAWDLGVYRSIVVPSTSFESLLYHTVRIVWL